tara:strand:- start:3789 stop:4241 length:453 start_codon:yes stop_codon:yes gene_type:complete
MSKIKSISLPAQKINFDTDIIVDREDIIYYDTKKHLNLIKFKKKMSNSSIPIKSKIETKSLSNRTLSGKTLQSSSKISKIKEYSGKTLQSSSGRMSPIKEYSDNILQSSSRMSPIKEYSGNTLNSSGRMSRIKDNKEYSGKSLHSSGRIS